MDNQTGNRGLVILPTKSESVVSMRFISYCDYRFYLSLYCPRHGYVRLRTSTIDFA